MTIITIITTITITIITITTTNITTIIIITINITNQNPPSTTHYHHPASSCTFYPSTGPWEVLGSILFNDPSPVWQLIGSTTSPGQDQLGNVNAFNMSCTFGRK